MKVLFALFFLPISLFGQLYYTLKIEGNDSVSISFARKMSYADSFLDTVSIYKSIEQITQSIRNEGYLSASINVISIDSTTQKAILTLGKKYDKGLIHLQNIPQSALNYAGLKNRKASVSILEFIKKRDKIIEFFENNAYPFASIYLDSIKISDDGINAIARVEKFNPITISSIKVVGYTQIDESFLMSQIGIKAGSLYDESAIKKIGEAISELSFIDIVGKPRIHFEQNNIAEIEIELRKKSANRFDGMIGFAPNTQNNNKLLITGKLSFELNNMLSKGELINLDWQKLDAKSQKLLAGYSIRYLFKTRLGSESNILLYKQDTSYMNTDIYTALPYYFTYNKLIKVYFEQKSSTLLDKSLISNVSTLPEYADISETSFGAGTKLWNLDYSYNPRKGYTFELLASSGIKKIDKNPQVDSSIYKNVLLKTKQVELKCSFSVYFPLSKRTVILLEDKSATMQNTAIYRNELYKIGGAKLLRGFDEGEIACSSYSVVNAEYRFLFQKNSNLFVFVNAAYYENKAATSHIHDTPYGFGLGLNVQNKSSIFSISYAYGSQFGNGIQFNAAKIHFGYLTVF